MYVAQLSVRIVMSQWQASGLKCCMCTISVYDDKGFFNRDYVRDCKFGKLVCGCACVCVRVCVCLLANEASPV